MKSATSHLFAAPNVYGGKAGRSLSESKALLEGNSIGERERAELQAIYDRISAEKEKEAEVLNKAIYRKKQQLQARESLPFSSNLLEDPRNGFAPKGANYVISDGDFIDIVPIKGSETVGLWRVKRIEHGAEEIFIERVTGDYRVNEEIKGNKKDNWGGKVRFNLWPIQWRPIAVTDDNRVELEIKQHEGTLESFLAKWDKEDIKAHALGDSLARFSEVVYLLEDGYKLHSAAYVDWEKLAWPDLNNTAQQNAIIDLAKKVYKTDIENGDLAELLLRYVGADWKERYSSEFKIIAWDDVDEVMTDRINAMFNSIGDKALADPVQLYRHMEADSEVNPNYSNLRQAIFGYLDELRKEGYDNLDDIEDKMKSEVYALDSTYRRQAREEMIRLQRIQDDKDRLEQEAIAAKERAEQDAKDEVVKAEREKAAEVASKAFAEAGGSQLSVEHKAAFKRLGYDAEIITSEWEYLGYKNPRNGRAVKGNKFAAGSYLKFEGGDLNAFTKKPNSTDIADRFAAFKQQKKYYWAKKLNIWVGREGDSIVITPISNIESDVAFYLGLLE